MKKLLVDLSHYPCAYFPQLDISMDIEEHHLYNYEEFDTTFFETYYSFSKFGLFDFTDSHDLLLAFAQIFEYDSIEYV